MSNQKISLAQLQRHLAVQKANHPTHRSPVFACPDCIKGGLVGSTFRIGATASA